MFQKLPAEVLDQIYLLVFAVETTEDGSIELNRATRPPCKDLTMAIAVSDYGGDGRLEVTGRVIGTSRDNDPDNFSQNADDDITIFGQIDNGNASESSLVSLPASGASLQPRSWDPKYIPCCERQPRRLRSGNASWSRGRCR
jgi:hypothetical protein